MKHSTISYRIIYAVICPVSLLPLSMLYRISAFFYFIGWKVGGYRKSVVIQNLSRSFPDMRYKEVRYLADSYALHLFRLFAEWLKSFTESEKAIRERIHFINHEYMDDENENVFLMLGHYGNWETLNILPLFTSRPVYAVYKRQSSVMAHLLSYRMRSRFGIRLLEAKEVTRFILTNKEKAVYVFIADQSPACTDKTYLHFLNQTTSVFKGVERLVSRVGGKVVYTEIVPSCEKEYTIRFCDIDNQGRITDSFFHHLEQTIRKAPQYWLWSHRRWKCLGFRLM